MIARLVHRYSLVVQDFPGHRLSTGKNLSEVECFVGCVLEFLSPSARIVLKRTLAHINRINELHGKIFKDEMFPPEESGSMHDANVLKAVIKYEVDLHPSEDWRLDEKGFSQVAADYFLLRDFHIGEHEQLLGDIVHTYGYFFLNTRDTNKVRAYRKSGKYDAMKKFIARKANPIVKLFWYFTVVLCRHLQQGENRLEAVDAYWLGIADEVVGEGLTGARLIMEEEIPNSPDSNFSLPSV